MKVIFIKAVGVFSEQDEVGKIHLMGAIDTTACGIANEDYEMKHTDKKLTCSTCIHFLNWAKKVTQTVKN